MAFEFNTNGPIHSSPCVDSQHVAYFGSDDGHMYAVRIDTGNKKWSVSLNGVVRSSPALSNDETAVYVGAPTGMYSLATSTGHQNWFVNFRGPVTGGPGVDNNNVIYVSDDNGLLYVRTPCLRRARGVFSAAGHPAVHVCAPLTHWCRRWTTPGVRFGGRR